jgi:riboflavin kinase/FMN adenylyltransferase
VWITSSLSTVLTPTSIALGNFDGLHRGHQKVIEPILPSHLPHLFDSSLADLSSRSPAGEHNQGSGGSGGGAKHPYSTLVTFDPHPQEFFSGESRSLLTPQVEKVQYLKTMGVQQLILLPFDRKLAALSPQAFVEEILIQKLQACYISVGEDFRFGHRRSGTVDDLKEIAQALGVKVQIVSLKKVDERRISSSAIRHALSQGDILEANQLLGRPYRLIGEVIQGQQLGRTLGFPTANLQLPPNKFLPRYGVYAVRVTRDDQPTKDHLGVMNIGCRPTVAQGQPPTIEIHLLDWSGDLYGKTLTVGIQQFLRPEQKFASLDQLKSQIQLDCIQAKSLASATFPL